jgi:hypothetical protein
MPCPNHATERCGGESTTGTPRGRSLITTYGEDEPPTVSVISVVSLLLLCSSAICSALCSRVVRQIHRNRCWFGDGVRPLFVNTFRVFRTVLARFAKRLGFCGVVVLGEC